MTPNLDLAFVRKQFPAFSVPALEGQRFFENAGGSYACGQVVERLNRYYRETKVQPYYPYPASTSGGEQMDQSHVRLAGYLGVASDEVYFGPSTTQNIYVLAQAAMDYLSAGDEVIVTNQDHEANSGAWRRLADKGIHVREWCVDAQTGGLDKADLAALLCARTRIVAFSHCSNILGQINPVREITDLIHQTDALAIVDGVSYAPHGLPNIAQLDADIYLLSLYKTYGPHQGIMVVRKDAARRFSNQGHYFNANDAEKRLTPAGPDHAQIAAAQGVVDYFDAVYEHHFDDTGSAIERARAVRQLFQRAERARLAPLLDFLRGHPRVRIVGPDSVTQRAPTVSIVAEAMAPRDLVNAMTQRGIMSGDGNFYAPRLLDAMGIDSDRGVNRFSFVHYTTDQEISALIAALDASL